MVRYRIGPSLFFVDDMAAPLPSHQPTITKYQPMQFIILHYEPLFDETKIEIFLLITKNNRIISTNIKQQAYLNAYGVGSAFREFSIPMG